MVEISLDQLKDVTLGALRYADGVGRPLLAVERNAFDWLLVQYESPALQQAIEDADDRVKDFHLNLILQLREALHPDPVRQPDEGSSDRKARAEFVTRLKRVKPEQVSELNPGNFSVKAPPFRGVSIRRMDASEATQRVELLAKLADGMAALTRELSLVRQSDRDEAAAISRAARRIVDMARTFAARCEARPALPPLPSTEELMEDMRAMNRLMAEPTPERGTE